MTAPPPPPRSTAGFSLSSHAPKVFFYLLFGALFAGLGTPISWLLLRVGRLTGPADMMYIAGLGLVIFGSVGLAFLASGVFTWRTHRTLWRHGKAVEATVQSVYRDTSIQMSGTTPVAIEYSYVCDGVGYAGTTQMYEGRPDDLDKGAVIWVLVHPTKRAVSLVYPQPDLSSPDAPQSD